MSQPPINPLKNMKIDYWYKALTVVVTNGAIVIHTQRLKSDPGGNLLS